MDQTTKKHIDLLHPSVRKEVTKIIEECDLALTGRAKVRITQGLRTFQEQEDLYAFGRTKPGKKVIEAYKQRFAKFDLRDAKGLKIDVNNLTVTDIENLFNNKYFMKHNGKLVPLNFDAHHIIPKHLLLDDDMIELRNFVSRNRDNFDFHGLDNGIPVHKLDSNYEALGGHATHPKYNELSREKILDLKKKSIINGDFNQDLFDENLLSYINETREKIINEVIAESKKINNLKL